MSILPEFSKYCSQSNIHSFMVTLQPMDMPSRYFPITECLDWFVSGSLGTNDAMEFVSPGWKLRTSTSRAEYDLLKTGFQQIAGQDGQPWVRQLDEVFQPSSDPKSVDGIQSGSLLCISTGAADGGVRLLLGHRPYHGWQDQGKFVVGAASLPPCTGTASQVFSEIVQWPIFFGPNMLCPTCLGVAS